jgi:6-phosphogluconolactonase (cycloisomerase 2 family)
VYVASDASEVTSYTIAPTTGALTLIGSAVAGLRPASIAVDPSGLYVYAANHDSNSVVIYTVGDGGALTAISRSPVPAGTQPSAIAID